jgi:hypothetical protein
MSVRELVLMQIRRLPAGQPFLSAQLHRYGRRSAIDVELARPANEGSLAARPAPALS